ncbi:hypothetical protein ACHAXS_012231 [Conticribra weissflogii]
MTTMARSSSRNHSQQRRPSPPNHRRSLDMSNRRICLLAAAALTVFWTSTLFLSMHLPIPPSGYAGGGGGPSSADEVALATELSPRGVPTRRTGVSSERLTNGQFSEGDESRDGRGRYRLRHPTRRQQFPSAEQWKSQLQSQWQSQLQPQSAIANKQSTRQQPTRQQPTGPQPQATNKSQPRDPRLIHVLETRFMQNQPHLVQLARARLKLFQTVCLPTVRHQTAWGNFLWIIRTDPDLDPEIQRDLIDLLEESGSLVSTKKEGEEDEQNTEGEGGNRDTGITYLVGSNDNYITANVTSSIPSTIRPFDVRHMLSSMISRPETISAGKLSSLRELLDDVLSEDDARSDQNNVVLWTRLDADDGLNVHYLEYVQNQAVRYFLPEYYSPPDSRHRLRLVPAAADDVSETPYRPPRWTYWCAGTNIDWFLDRQRRNGTVFPVQHSNVCVTPGVTIALMGETEPGAVPRLDHDKIVSFLRGKETAEEEEDGEGGGTRGERKSERGSLCGRKGRSVVEKIDNDDDDDDDDDESDDDDDEEEEEPDDGTCFHMIHAFSFSAIRSRTPTSAGMLGISPTLTQLEIVRRHPAVQSYMWTEMGKNFRIGNEELVKTNEYFGEMVFEIAEENARGQCTEGHSCKTSSKDLLQQYVDLKKEMMEGFEIDRRGMIIDQHKLKMISPEG